MKNSLYIIGNGFDCYHDLPTEYSNFHLFLKNNYPKLEEELNQFFDFKVKNGLWCDFETDLGSFNFQLFYNDSNSSHVSSNDIYAFQVDKNIDYSFVSKLRTTFLSWFKSIDYRKAGVLLDIKNNALFMTFNYTHILENTYQIPENNVFHIHGSLKNGALIFGHNTTIIGDPEFGEDGKFIQVKYTKSQSLSMRPLSDFYKPVRDIIDKNNSFFKQLSSIEKVIVLGYSFNDIDAPYLKEVVKCAFDARWTVSYYKDFEKSCFKDSLCSYGVPNEKIPLVSINIC